MHTCIDKVFPVWFGTGHPYKLDETEERRGFLPLGQLFAHLSLSRLPQLLVFNVTPFKIDQNKSQTRSIDKVQRPSPRFRSEEYSVYEKPEELSYPTVILNPKKCLTQQ